jgi:HNH endonuclease
LSFGLQDKIVAQLASLKIELDDSVITFSDIDKKLLREAIGRSSINKSLLRYVPYRLLRPFFSDELRGVKEYRVDSTTERLAKCLFDERKPLYRIDTAFELIYVHGDWLKYLNDNYVIVKAWASWHWLEYMQRRNPNTPAVSSKLFPPLERDPMKEQTKYWRLVVGHRPIRCIYSGVHLSNNNISLDHYLPWSYVAHNQLWNLVPTLPTVNSAKSNCIPAARYFDSLINLQHQGLITTQQYLSERAWEKHVIPFISDLKIADTHELLDPDKLSIAYKRTLLPLISLAERLGFQANWRY